MLQTHAIRNWWFGNENLVCSLFTASRQLLIYSITRHIFKFYFVLFQQTNKQTLSNNLLIDLLTDKNAT